MADENDIKKLTEYRQLLSDVLSDTGKLTEQVSAYFGAFGETMEGSIGSASDAKEQLQKIVDISTKQDGLNKNQITALQNVQQLLNSQLRIGGEKVELDEEQRNILAQILKLNQANLKTTVSQNIEAGKSLNLIGRYKVQKEQINNLTKEEARMALVGLMTQNKIANLATDLIGTISSMIAELNKMTSDSQKYAEIAIASADAIAGVSYQEALAAQKELISGLSSYTRMSVDQQKAISTNTVLFEKLGLSAKNQIVFTEMAIKSFGMSAKEAGNFMTELQSFSESANIPMSEINKNMGALGEKMALFGRANYQQVFKDLTAAAKDFGIEANKMLDITERFTTFEGAAQAAGRLNAILGGNFVSGLRLMNSALEDPVDVFRQLKTAIDMSGKEFENMSQAQKRYVAEKIGVSVAEAEKLFGQSLNESTQALKDKQKTQEELAEIAAKSTQVFERLRIAFQKIVNTPLVGWAVKTVEGFAKFIEYLSDEDNYVGTFLTGLMGLIAGLGLLAKGIAFLFSPFMTFMKFLGLSKLAIFGKSAATATDTASLKANTLALEENMTALKAHQLMQKQSSISTKGMGTAGSGAALGMLKFAAALAIVGAVIAVVSLSFGAMAAGFALWNEMQARNTEATTRQAEVFADLADKIKEMPGLKTNLESFAAGIQKIATAINNIKLETLKELNTLTAAGFNTEFMSSGTATIETNVVPVKVVEVEMKQQQEIQNTKNTGTGGSTEVKLSINSPLTLDGADFGRLIYNGIAVYQESLNRDITPAPSMFTANQLMNWNKG